MTADKHDKEIIDNSDESELGDIPKVKNTESYFNSITRRVIYQTNNYTLEQLRDMISSHNFIDLQPEYQRRLRWDMKQKTKLIESFLLNMPIPPLYFYEVEYNKFEVMDGQQRLNSLREFYENEFNLAKPEVLIGLKDQYYKNFSERTARVFNRTSIHAIIVFTENMEIFKSAGNEIKSSDIRRLIFERLNTGGKYLNPQEIRNAINPGPFNELIIKLTKYGKFTEVFGIPAYTDQVNDPYENAERLKNTIYKNMKDCEYVLRYFALREPKKINGSLKAILDRAAEKKIKRSEIEKYTNDYCSRFDFLYELFDSRPFEINEKGKNKLAIALYDSSMVALDLLWDKKDKIHADKKAVNERLKAVLKSQESYDAIVRGKSSPKDIKNRIEILKHVLIGE